MKRLLPVVLLLVALSVASSQEQKHKDAQGHRRPKPPQGVKLVADLEYGQAGGHPMLLDLYLPENSEAGQKPLPLIVWIHGGGWRNGTRSNIGPSVNFVPEGFAVASLDYRWSTEAIFPAQIYDCKAAVRWLRANAQQYHLDTNKFAAWGESAGGHLAALLGTTSRAPGLEGKVNDLKESSRVQAVIDWFGPSDFLVDTDNGSAPESMVAQLLGGRALDDRQRAARASPIAYVAKDNPPFLIMQGDKDQAGVIHQSELLYSVMKKTGVDVTFVMVKGAGHGVREFDAAGAQAIDPVRDFLKRIKEK